MTVFIGARVKTSAFWKVSHPMCKPRGFGTVINIKDALFGRIISVNWDSGRRDSQFSERDLVVVNGDDGSADYVMSP